MPTHGILSLLVAERDKIQRAIDALGIEPKRRGRPPGRRGPGRPPRSVMGGGGSVPAPFSTGTGRKRHGMSAAARKAQSARMRAYWAAKRKRK